MSVKIILNPMIDTYFQIQGLYPFSGRLGQIQSKVTVIDT